ncbi:porin [Limnohabitans sp.]|uniref:porin n=1 Tax=Limnohabitans sp. TaxID=1907725 RepID=UPI002FDC9EB8
MKKTLVAIAALTAVSAFAQVTLTGYMDRAYTITNSTLDTADAKALSSSAGTTGIVIAASEDLGGGMRAGASIATDWAEAGGLTQDGSSYAVGTAGGNIPTANGSFGNAQSFLFIQDAKLGTLRLGNINNEVLTAVTGVGSPFSTGVGSAYSANFSVHDGYGSGTSGRNNQVINAAASATNVGVRGIRQVNTIKYVSPKFMDVTVSYGFTTKNDNAPVTIAGTTTNPSNSTLGVTDMSIRYQAGPVDVMYATLKYKVGADTTANGGTLTGTAGLTANSTNTHSVLAASYAVMPSLKISAATGGSKASVDSIANSKFTQYGIVYTMGNFDVMAQMATVDNKNAATATVTGDRKMTGLGLNYNFTKTARAYVRYDNLKYADGAATATPGSEVKRTAIGISKSF